MAAPFSTPIEYFGRGSDTVIKLKSSSEGGTSQNKEAVDARGDVIARAVYGAIVKPSGDYEVQLAGNFVGVLGAVNTVDSVVICVTGVNVVLKSGTPPAVKIMGESLQAGATVSSTITLPTIALTTLHKAVDPLSGITLSGTGCELHEVEIDATCTLSRATVAGETIAHDIMGGKLTIKYKIAQSGETKPTATAGTGFTITEPLTCSNPDEDYPTWTVAVMQNTLASVEPA